MIMMMAARASFIKNVGVANCDSFFLHIVAENLPIVCNLPFSATILYKDKIDF